MPECSACACVCLSVRMSLCAVRSVAMWPRIYHSSRCPARSVHVLPARKSSVHRFYAALATMASPVECTCRQQPGHSLSIASSLGPRRVGRRGKGTNLCTHCVSSEGELYGSAACSMLCMHRCVPFSLKCTYTTTQRDTHNVVCLQMSQRAQRAQQNLSE